jgi:deoxyribodipyrimidine photolyase
MIKKYDKECIYIKRWLPELKNIPNNDIYKWNIDSV